MRVGLLGPLEIVDDAGRRIALAGPRQGVLVAALAVRANEAVPRGALAEAVWDGAPPPGYAATLRSLLRRVRNALGPEAARIVTRASGYLIELGAGELDLAEFELLCREANAAVHEDAWEMAADAAQRALGLWRGEPLADLPSQVLRDACTPRLEQLQVQVLEDGIEAQLRLGGHEQMLGRLREVTVRYPLRERFHAQLMLALARTGRRAEALAAYQDARRALVDELGIEPGPELRTLQDRILAGDESMATARPEPSARGAVASPVPRQLPVAARHFTGRGDELGALIGASTQTEPTGGVVVICAVDGMAGIGKTALAVHAAHRLAERFPDGQLFADLHGHTQGYLPCEPGDVLDRLLRALGVPAAQIPEDTETRAALYRQRLADSRVLILLDNALNEGQVRPLLPAAPGCLVLVTSRRRLKGLDDARSVSLDLLPQPDADALLRAVAGPERIADGDPGLAAVAGLCGHLPLALRIAGALLRHRPAWDVNYLAALLRDQHRRLGVLSDGERDLGAMFDLSYADLDEQHRLLFRRLGLIPGPDADAYAAAAMLACDPGTAARLLEDLVDHNLLMAHAPGRYRLHDLIRAHAAAMAAVDPQPERDAAMDRLLHYYAHTAQSASVLIARYPRPAPDGPAPAYAPALTGPEAARAWLRAERENLEAAFAHARTSALDGHVLALAAGLAEILRNDGPFTRAVTLHQAAAETAERHGRPDARATALTELGYLRSMTGSFSAASDDLRRAAEIYRATGHRLGEATALTSLGYVQHLAGDSPGALDAQTTALEIYRAIGNRNGEADALNNLGDMQKRTGDYPAALDAQTTALEIYRAIGNRRGEAVALTSLGSLRMQTGDHPAALDALTTAAETYRTLGNRVGEANALTQLGDLRVQTGDHPAALDHISRALDIYRALGSRTNEAWALNHYAAAIAAIGDHPRALALYHQALAMNRELKKPDDEAVSLEGIANHHLATDNPAQGTAHLRQALEIYQRLGMRLDIERVQARLAEIAGPHV